MQKRFAFQGGDYEILLLILAHYYAFDIVFDFINNWFGLIINKNVTNMPHPTNLLHNLR